MPVQAESGLLQVTAKAKGAPAVRGKWYAIEAAAEPKEATLASVQGQFCDGVSQTETDAVGETFSLARDGNRLVDSAAVALAADVLVMTNNVGDTIAYVKAVGNWALGISRGTTSGGAGEEVLVQVFNTPQNDCALL